MKLLVVVDMQIDFVNGSLGTPEAQAIVDNVVKKVQEEKENGCEIIFTMDTHGTNYLDTLEGKNLPVPHCIKDTEGWQIIPQLRSFAEEARIIEKPTFGSTLLAHLVVKGGYDEIELVGLCTDICVLSNAMVMKASVPETPIFVDSSCCAGVTPQSHKNALEAMKMCQIVIK